jgi:hypothetical protein
MGLKLTDISPAASLIKGEGLMNYAGIIPAMLTEKRKKNKKKEAEAMELKETEKLKSERMISEASKMKAGGRTRSRPIDGCATRGKTKGRFV